MVVGIREIEFTGRRCSVSDLFEDFKHQSSACGFGSVDDSIQPIMFTKGEFERAENATHVQLLNHFMHGDCCACFASEQLPERRHHSSVRGEATGVDVDASQSR